MAGAIVMVALAGVCLYLLAESSKSLKFETDRMQYEFRARNLRASAAAWAQRNAASLADGAPRRLDVGAMDAGEAELTVRRTAQGEFRADIGCYWGGKLIRRENLPFGPARSEGR
ncbi:MAG TPA: hypothetical protein DCX07_03050 [Phycisphaerales bacterium]|nr:hypothetical protein [Phycisphaerales bacterium]